MSQGMFQSVWLLIEGTKKPLSRDFLKKRSRFHPPLVKIGICTLFDNSAAHLYLLSEVAAALHPRITPGLPFSKFAIAPYPSFSVVLSFALSEKKGEADAKLLFSVAST